MHLTNVSYELILITFLTNVSYERLDDVIDSYLAKDFPENSFELLEPLGADAGDAVDDDHVVHAVGLLRTLPEEICAKFRHMNNFERPETGTETFNREIESVTRDQF
jgi:hypothetical protein